MNTPVVRDPPTPEAFGWVLGTHGWWNVYILASPQTFPEGGATATSQGVEEGSGCHTKNTRRQLCGEMKESAGEEDPEVHVRRLQFPRVWSHLAT